MSSRSSSRERVVNLFTITLVTILIWMWAAGETRRTEQAFATLDLVPPTEGTLRVTPDDIPNVEFEIRGSQRAVSAAVERFRQQIEIPAGSKGLPAEPGEHQLSLEDLGEALVEEWRLPVTIMSADPPSIAVTIESLLREEARVVPSLPGSARVVGNTEVSPTVTTMILPGDQATQAQLGDLVLDARVSSDDLDGRLPGALHRIQVPLVIPDSIAARLRAAGVDPDAVRLEPSSAQVTLTLDSNEVELELPNPVPVQIAGPSGTLDDWIVTIDASSTFLRNVVVRGPKDVIAQFEDRAAGPRVIAFVHLTSDDLLTGAKEKPVTLWSLPEGVRVTSVGGDATSAPRVQLEIVERTD